MNLFAVFSALLYAGLIQYIILKPIYLALQEDMNATVKFIIFIKICAYSAIFVSYLLNILSAYGSFDNFNYYLSISLSIIAFFCLLEFTVVSFHVRRFLRILKHTENYTKRSARVMIERLRFLQISFGVFSIPVGLFSSIICITIFLIGSLPYLYILVSLFFIFYLFSLLGIYRFLSPSKEQSISRGYPFVTNHMTLNNARKAFKQAM